MYEDTDVTLTAERVNQALAVVMEVLRIRLNEFPTGLCDRAAFLEQAMDTVKLFPGDNDSAAWALGK
jgi:hypothetical protein